MIQNKSAQTRFENDLAQGKRMTMPGNQAAQMSLRHQVSGAKKPTNPVRQPVDYSAIAPQPTEPVDLPTGGPQMEQMPEFDPAVFKEDMINNLVGTIRTQKFVESPRVKDAQTSIQLKEFFNQHNPNRKPDQRDITDRVVDRMGMKYAKSAPLT